jgi:hypothetical protein
MGCDSSQCTSAVAHTVTPPFYLGRPNYHMLKYYSVLNQYFTYQYCHIEHVRIETRRK